MATRSREDRAWRLQGRGRQLLAGAVLAVLLIAVAVLILRGLQSPPTNAVKLAPLQPLQSGAGLQRGDVRKVEGNVLTIDGTSGSRQIELPADVRVEVLLPAAPDAVGVGDYLLVGGLPNLVNSFAIKLVVVIPVAQASAPNGGSEPHSAGGFTGWETYQNPAEAPEAFGRVDAVVPGGFVVSGPRGNVTVLVDGQSALRRISAGGVTMIHGGDHVALRTGSDGRVEAVLVLPGQ